MRAAMPALLVVSILAPLAKGQETVKQYKRCEIPSPGEILYLHDGDGDPIHVASDLFAWEDMVKFLKARDDQGLRELIDAGRVARIDDDTQIRFLELTRTSKFRVAEVRILDGPQAGKAVWVSSYYLNYRRIVAAKKKRRHR